MEPVGAGAMGVPALCVLPGRACRACCLCRAFLYRVHLHLLHLLHLHLHLHFISVAFVIHSTAQHGT